MDIPAYKKLYNHRQTLPRHIKRNEVLALAQKYSGKKAILVCSGKITENTVRGFFLESNTAFNHGFEFAKEQSLIFYARSMNRCWTRIVIMKESMHLFDTPTGATRTADAFESLLDEFMVPKIPMSEKMRSENLAFWMALGLVCTEEHRGELEQKRANQVIEDEDIAKELRIPKQYVSTLLGSDFTASMEYILNA